ncbi:hypothetical protein CEE60_09950 [Stenotrophomonas maltophilia]|uniref:Uncharacterized protein n=1 Tax=Stenotrophomonas maltophilia TaxID=40324 RepID=A0A246HNV8_STEMA|nr:hypothetical protein [Stenotrophomonas maltophilia]OWQ53975.1 hypothetical protein CEE60_09950 [Stenotrophomonas maltophilia]
MTTNKSNAAPDPQPAELSFDVEAMLTACVPGGRIVDPQVVADNIRAWVADRKPAELAEQQADALIDTALGYLSTALDDLDSSPDRRPGIMVTEAMQALREAIATRQPGAQEPVGEVYQGSARLPQARLSKPLPIGSLLYAAPPAQGIDLGKLWEQAHAAMLNQRKRNKHDCFVLRCLKEDVKKLIDGQRDAAPGVES